MRRSRLQNIRHIKEYIGGIAESKIDVLYKLASRIDSYTHKELRKRRKVASEKLTSVSWTQVKRTGKASGFVAQLRYGYPKFSGQYNYALTVDIGTDPMGKTQAKRRARRTGKNRLRGRLARILEWVELKGIVFKKFVKGAFVPMTPEQTVYMVNKAFNEVGVRSSEFAHMGVFENRSRWKKYGNTITDHIIYKFRPLIRQMLSRKPRGRSIKRR